MDKEYRIKGLEPLKEPEGLRERLGIKVSSNKIGLSEERIEACVDKLRAIISFFRWYPDLYLDKIKAPDEKFEFYFYQRIFLRLALRMRYMYATFPRAYSKSFLSILALYLICIFYPNSKLFIVSGGKEQSAKIAMEKIEEIWKFFPSLKNEVIIQRGVQGGSSFQRDYIKLVFKNGSYLDVVAAKQSSRGGRKTGGLIEESATVDGKILSEVVIPMMNVSRRAAFGREDKNDIKNKGQLYITTAGDKGTFAYEKLQQIFLWSLIRPDESICIGGSWRVPVACGLLSPDFVKDLKSDGTYSDQTFSREYESRWGGGNAASFFSSVEFDKNRVIPEPLLEAPIRPVKGSLIILSYDVGRTSDDSSLIVIQLIPTNIGGGLTYLKKIVNIISFEKMHFLEQSICIKKIYYQYKASKIVIDANGLGIGLVDFLTVSNLNEKTGETIAPFGVDKDSDPKGHYKKFYTVPGGMNGIIYLVKAGEGSNKEMHNTCSTQIASGKVQFLIDDQLAEEKLKRREVWKTYSVEKRIEILRPYKLTKILREEMLNLKEVSDSRGTLKRISPRMKKDKFSALEYGIWYARQLELKNPTRGIAPTSLGNISKSSYSRDGSNIRDRFKGSGGWKRG